MGSISIAFDPTDPDRATGRSAVVAFIHTADGQISTRGLHYTDVFVRRSSAWRFAERHHNVDWEYQTPLVPIGVIQ